MTFRSVLFNRPEDSARAASSRVPPFFPDLNLDQVVDTITAGKDEYSLKPFFYTPLRDTDAIAFRHEVMQDLADAKLFANFRGFAEGMRRMRAHLVRAEKLSYQYQKQWWCLEAVATYCHSVDTLVQQLSASTIKSRGLLAFRDYLTTYFGSRGFTSLAAETTNLKVDLAKVDYCLLIKGGCIKVRNYDAEADYSAKVEDTFRRFQQGEVKDYRIEMGDNPHMNHIEEQILGYVTQLNPHVFARLNTYCATNGSFLDETVSVFDREIQFYIAYLEYASVFVTAGLSFCYPQVSPSKEVCDFAGYDLALAHKLLGEAAPVVCNDFSLEGPERIIVVSGPNQGGKTTFSRTFGQLHYLASLGCPIPGTEAKLFLFDSIHTHFEREETIETLRGKLEDDLVRIHEILEHLTPDGIVIMNEIFTSTTLQDQILLSRKVMAKLVALDVLCVWVTFIDELATFGEKTVSMVSTIVPENPAIRTFKIERRPPDGLAYAMSIVEKYRLTQRHVKERIKT